MCSAADDEATAARGSQERDAARECEDIFQVIPSLCVYIERNVRGGGRGGRRMEEGGRGRGGGYVCRGAL